MSRSEPEWATVGRDWPNRESSRFVEAAGVRWHVQVAGRGPVLLLLHGTAAATHSWAALLPRLAAVFTVVAPDLPGHGFTSLPRSARLDLPGMAGDVATLLRALEVVPTLAVGHSAGATILARLILDGALVPRGLVVLDHSLTSPFHPTASVAASIAARIARTPAVAWLASRFASPAVVGNRLRSTGSVLTPAEVARYAALMRSPRHVGAALTMMSRWDLASLERDLDRLALPTLVLAGERDTWFRPELVAATASRLPRGSFHVVGGTGHLSHEERPEEVARLILSFATAIGASARDG